MLRDQLIAGGVDSEAIAIEPLEQEAVQAALDLADVGDLLLIFGDKINRTWKQIINHSPDLPEQVQKSEPDSAAPLPPVDISASQLTGEEEIVTDERGVWIARETED